MIPIPPRATPTYTLFAVPARFRCHYCGDLIVTRVLPAAFDFLQQVILHLPYFVAAHFPIIGVQHFLFPFTELRHAVLWQTKQIEDDIARIFLRNFVPEVTLTAILECGNQVDRTSTRLNSSH